MEVKTKKLHNRILEILAFKTESVIYRTLTSSFTRPCGNKIFNWQEKKEEKKDFAQPEVSMGYILNIKRYRTPHIHKPPQTSCLMVR